MEQQQGNPRPPMPPENYGKRMWQLWGPILIKWGIEFLVSLLAMTALAMAYQLTDPAAFRAAMESQEAMFDLYDRLISSYLEAGTLIQTLDRVFGIACDHTGNVDFFPSGQSKRKKAWDHPQ